MLFLTVPVAAESTVALRFSGAVSLPISSHVSKYLKTGIGGGAAVLIKQNFWPLTMQLSTGYISYGLTDLEGISFSLVPLTIGLLYKLPFTLLKKSKLFIYAESGISWEILRSKSETNHNTAFTAGIGTRFIYQLSNGFDTGLSIQYNMLTETGETASFLTFILSFDVRL